MMMMMMMMMMKMSISGWWWGREQKWHWCQVEGIAKWHRTLCANNKQQQLHEQAIRQGGRRVHWSIQLFQGGRMWRLRGNGFSKVAKLRQRRRTCTLRPSGLTIAFIICCEGRNLLFIRKTQSDAVLMSPATDMNFQCICSSCRYELNYQIFDSHANHLENLEGSKRRRSHWKVGLSCKLRKYKNLKLNCSKGKLTKYRIGNFLMQEQQESRLATRRKKAQKNTHTKNIIEQKQ